MTCRDATRLIFAERDRVLAAIEREALEQHVARCAECRAVRNGMTAAATTWRETSAGVPVPDPGGEWRLVRQRLRAGGAAAARATPRLRRPAWAALTGLPLVAAAAIALIVWLQPRATFIPASEAALASVAPSRAEFVEAADTAASTVVYVDQESGWLIVWAATPARS